MARRDPDSGGQSIGEVSLQENGEGRREFWERRPNRLNSEDTNAAQDFAHIETWRQLMIQYPGFGKVVAFRHSGNGEPPEETRRQKPKGLGPTGPRAIGRGKLPKKGPKSPRAWPKMSGKNMVALRWAFGGTLTTRDTKTGARKMRQRQNYPTKRKKRGSPF